MSTQILHIADTHIGYAQYNSEVRRADFLQAFNHCIEIAIDRDVAAVVHAGDLFHRNQPRLDDLGGVVSALQRLREAGIPFLGICGNHEHRRDLHWLDFLAGLGLAAHLGSEPVHVGDVPIYGLDYRGRWDVELPRIDGGVLVAHQMLDDVFSKGELALETCLGCGADYVLLGDYHGHAQWRQSGTIVTYSGSTERTGVNERARRGVSLIDLETGRLDRVQLDTRPFFYIDEDVEGTLRARRHQLEGAVVVARLDTQGNCTRVQRLADEYRAEHLHAMPAEDLDPEARVEPPPPLTLEYNDIDEELDRFIAEHITSDIVVEIDAIIRDLTIPDSKVDEKVTEVLKKHFTCVNEDVGSIMASAGAASAEE